MPGGRIGGWLERALIVAVFTSVPVWVPRKLGFVNIAVTCGTRIIPYTVDDNTHGIRGVAPGTGNRGVALPQRKAGRIMLRHSECRRLEPCNRMAGVTIQFPRH